ncbi:MAG: exonuclease domain-containing protein [Desulforhabdus sp.]|nr:exonuclease domain-containing protein [Desulforhabdus sp.]
MDFVALDLETANPDVSSICQVGLVSFTDGLLQKEWKTYIDPEDFFDQINISIHGIDESKVEGAPTFPDVVDFLFNQMDGRIAVCHTHFDRVAIKQACEKYGMREPTCTWLDSACVARRTWEQFAYRGYGLSNVCAAIGYQFEHHDALEDAKAAAHIIFAAIEKTGIGLSEWLERVEQRIGFPYSSGRIAQDGNPDGVLYGETIVFTGALKISRAVAAEMAAKAGCAVAEGVNKRTTILVVGDQDVKKLAGHEKSSKHRKAEKLITDGYQIRILRESDFRELVL